MDLINLRNDEYLVDADGNEQGFPKVSLMRIIVIDNVINRTITEFAKRLKLQFLEPQKYLTIDLDLIPVSKMNDYSELLHIPNCTP